MTVMVTVLMSPADFVDPSLAPIAMAMIATRSPGGTVLIAKP